jgi:hypothetical protein
MARASSWRPEDEEEENQGSYIFVWPLITVSLRGPIGTHYGASTYTKGQRGETQTKRLSVPGTVRSTDNDMNKLIPRRGRRG